MDYDNVNVDSLEAALEELKSYTSTAEPLLKASFSEISDDNWKSEVKGSLTQKVTQIDEKISKLEPMINNYKSILELIRQYQSHLASYKEAKSQLANAQGSLASLEANPTFLNWFERQYWKSQVDWWQRQFDKYLNKVNELKSQIGGASL